MITIKGGHNNEYKLTAVVTEGKILALYNALFNRKEQSAVANDLWHELVRAIGEAGIRI